jgi:N-acetylglucosaminyldiphosphoundecaprenol N-acetyl-beta-D-mannosaminyltransferase
MGIVATTQAEVSLEPLSILGVGVLPFESYDEAVAYVERAIASGRKSFGVAINPEKVYQATLNSELMAALAQADMGICDGVGVALAARLLHGRWLRRCTGCDLFFRLIAKAAEKGWRVFLLGASPESNEGACEVLSRQYPGLRIAGRRDGYFTDSSEVVRQINASGADLLFVAMGSPRQELWIAEHRPELDAPFCMGVGGTFDVVSGKARRAPAVFRRTGTEFLFRLLSSPARWRRQAVLPLFLLKVLQKKLGLPPHGAVSVSARTRAWPWQDVAPQENAEGTHGDKHTTT